MLNNCHIFYLQRASCFATESGLKVAVEAGKCSQANAFIQTEIFQVNLTILLSFLESAMTKYKILFSSTLEGEIKLTLLMSKKVHKFLPMNF
jgi:hypothetical protein